MTIALTISFSESSELSRVKETIKRLPWYREHNYSETFAKLPLDITEASTEEEMVAAVSKEYDRQFFKKIAEDIQDKWGTVASGFEELRKMHGIELRDSYAVVLTKYGSGGSYDLSTGTLIINIGSPKKRERIIGVIVHEIVHLTIQNLIDKYEVPHWSKEKLVDMLLERHFPALGMSQNIPEDVSEIESAFNSLFPDMEAIAREVGTKR